ncbi:MAG: hypothetical protein KDA33_16760 [Phycisphaerales bacterium]|nr:hypothetical protein [Phycisphaerales bacterium]
MKKGLVRLCAALFLIAVRPANAQLAGDLNGDCVVTIDDVVSFVDVLIGAEDDVELVAAADVDGNSVADARDIEPFVSQLMTMAQCFACQTQASGFAGGDGSAGDPYQICSAAQLLA